MDKQKLNLQIKVLKLAQVILWIIIIAFFLKIASYVKEIFLSFSIAILINYLLSQPVDFLTKYIRYRFISVLVIVLGLLTGIGILFAYLLPTLITQLLAFKNSLPRLVANVDMFLVKMNGFLEKYFIYLPFERIDRVKLLDQLLNLVPKIDYSGLGNIASTVLSSSVFVVAYIFLTLIISFYLLVDGKRAWEMFLQAFAPKITTYLQAIKQRIDIRLHAFVTGQTQIASLTAMVMTVTYLVLNVPYSLVLGLAQLLEIIPVVGTWVAIVPCLLIVMFTAGFVKALIALVVYLAYSQLVRDNFVAPRVLGSSLGFHPLAILMSLLIGAQLGGVTGVILALPTLAVVTSFLDYNLEISELSRSSS